MKPIPGKIIIKEKVYFEPDGLEEPKEEDYFIGSSFHQAYFNGAMEEYEASKQLIEVENETYPVIIKDNEYWILLEKSWNICKDSQPCEAKIVKESATIISLTKQKGK